MVGKFQQPGRNRISQQEVNGEGDYPESATHEWTTRGVLCAEALVWSGRAKEQSTPVGESFYSNNQTILVQSVKFIQLPKSIERSKATDPLPVKFLAVCPAVGGLEPLDQDHKPRTCSGPRVTAISVENPFSRLLPYRRRGT